MFSQTLIFVTVLQFFSQARNYFAENLLSNFMAAPNCINVHIVGACGVGHQVDFRELCLKGQCQGQSLNKHFKNHSDDDHSRWSSGTSGSYNIIL